MLHIFACILQLILIIAFQIYVHQELPKFQALYYTDKPIKSYFTYQGSMHSMQEQAQKLKLKYESNPKKADLILSYGVKHKDVGDDQMMIYMPSDWRLNSKRMYSMHLNNFDKLKMFRNYNSTYFYPKSYEIHLIPVKGSVDRLDPTLTEDEKELISKNITGIWILKPTDGMQGNTIQMIHDVSKFQQTLKWKSQGKKDPNFKFQRVSIDKYILQKYIENPLLLDGKKFDLRCFIGIISTDPFISVFYMGYSRKTLVDYDPFSDDIKVHLGNGDIQKQHPDFDKLYKINTQHSAEQLKQKMMREVKGFTEEKYEELVEKIKAASTYSLMSVLDIIKRRRGDIQIMAIDLVLDDQFNPFVVEMNRTPYMATSTDVFQQIFPPIIKSWLELGIKINELKQYKVIEQSKENPRFFCKYLTGLDQNKYCDVILNEAAGYNCINDFQTEEWTIPQLVQVDKQKYSNQKQSTDNKTTNSRLNSKNKQQQNKQN